MVEQKGMPKLSSIHKLNYFHFLIRLESHNKSQQHSESHWSDIASQRHSLIFKSIITRI